MNRSFSVQFSPWSRLRDSGLVLSFWQRSLWHGLQHFHGVGFGAWAASLGVEGGWFWVIQVHLESKRHENNMEYCWGNLNSCIHVIFLHYQNRRVYYITRADSCAHRFNMPNGPLGEVEGATTNEPKGITWYSRCQCNRSHMNVSPDIECHKPDDTKANWHLTNSDN